MEELKQAKSAGRSLSFGVETRDVREGTISAQQPKLFYRREIERNACVISNPK